MENKKLKLLFTGKKGILLQRLPEDIEGVFKMVEKYYKVDSNKIQVTFKDREKDECEVLDNNTYRAACMEFDHKVVFNISVFQSVPISRLNPVKVVPQRKSLKYFKKKSRKMAIFDVETETIQWVSFQPGVIFKEYAAWVDLPSGEIFYCGGGHPISSKESYLLNPYTQTFQLLPDMLTPRHSHGITYTNNSVFIIGGVKNMLFFGSMMSECESFDLSLLKWQKISELNEPLGDAAAVTINEEVFMFGKGSSMLTKLNSPEFKIDLKEDDGGCMISTEGLIYVFQGSRLKICDIEKMQVVEEVELPKKESWWSHCPPVVYQEFIYFVWWEEHGWICRYNIQSKEFKKVVSLYVF